MSGRLTFLSYFRPMEAVHPTTPEQIQKYGADNGNINTKHHKIGKNVRKTEKFKIYLDDFHFRRLKH